VTAVLVVHAVTALLMCGVVLFVGVVHYPLLACVGPGAFAEYHRRHAQRTTWVVAPLMLAEAVTAGWLAATLHTDARAWINAALVAACWGVTFGRSVPQHARLSAGFDAGVWRALLTWHWVRTLAWIAHAVLAVWMLVSPYAWRP
jgi:hypothetical protein